MMLPVDWLIPLVMTYGTCAIAFGRCAPMSRRLFWTRRAWNGEKTSPAICPIWSRTHAKPATGSSGASRGRPGADASTPKGSPCGLKIKYRGDCLIDIVLAS